MILKLSNYIFIILLNMPESSTKKLFMDIGMLEEALRNMFPSASYKSDPERKCYSYLYIYWNFYARLVRRGEYYFIADDTEFNVFKLTEKHRDKIYRIDDCIMKDSKVEHDRKYNYKIPRKLSQKQIYSV
ncbi:MAG: hypothetical protein H7A25_25865 [Leptospiraceae bacterium]|nr:hypothetical protein [Leptospiraceae bacterium]